MLIDVCKRARRFYYCFEKGLDRTGACFFLVDANISMLLEILILFVIGTDLPMHYKKTIRIQFFQKNCTKLNKDSLPCSWTKQCDANKRECKTGQSSQRQTTKRDNYATHLWQSLGTLHTNESLLETFLGGCGI